MIVSPTTETMTAAPVTPSRGRLRPLGLTEVRITGGSWAQRQQVNGEATIPHIESWLERAGWLANFDYVVTGTVAERHRGRVFSDSEIYKLLEAMAWEIARTGDADLECRFRAIVKRVGAAQEADGYLSTAFGHPGQPERWSDLEWGHELYCLGHLFQAAVARARTRPGADDGLIEIACRAADLVCGVFGPQGVPAVCGHPEVETALAELARVTNEQKYAAQAALFIERRGHGTLRDIEFGRSYYQDDIPVRDAKVLRGHAVRAGYLAAGAVDVAVETGDTELLAALQRQWHSTITRRTYITGGQGSQHEDEGFGDDFALPPDRAYSETCAGIASIMFSWRLLLATGSPAYGDLIERTLFNVVATSPSREGTAFFYANTLHQRSPGEAVPAGVISPRASSSVRSSWFDVSCCPPNVARMLASLAAYVATVDDDGIQLHQYAPSEIRTVLPNGQRFEADVETGYPYSGDVVVTVRNDSTDLSTLTLRVPEWAVGAQGAELVVEPVDGQPATRRDLGRTVSVRRSFRTGDRVVLRLPVVPRVSVPDPRIDAVRGCVAIEAGPLVYCLESTDLAIAGGGELGVDEVTLDLGQRPTVKNNTVTVHLKSAPALGVDWPYVASGAVNPQTRREFTATLIPYSDWAERGPCTMRVWIPTTS